MVEKMKSNNFTIRCKKCNSSDIELKLTSPEYGYKNYDDLIIICNKCGIDEILPVSQE